MSASTIGATRRRPASRAPRTLAIATTVEVDVVLWCTGFRPELRHLRPLALPQVDGHPRTDATTCVDEPRLHLVGYGDWTGPASATLVGVGATAKETAARIVADLHRFDSPLT